LRAVGVGQLGAKPLERGLQLGGFRLRHVGRRHLACLHASDGTFPLQSAMGDAGLGQKLFEIEPRFGAVARVAVDAVCLDEWPDYVVERRARRQWFLAAGELSWGERQDADNRGHGAIASDEAGAGCEGNQIGVRNWAGAGKGGNAYYSRPTSFFANGEGPTPRECSIAGPYCGA
jgi:hypothetical protein